MLMLRLRQFSYGCWLAACFSPKVSKNFSIRQSLRSVAFRKSAFRRRNSWVRLSAGVETICGALLILGFLTRPAAILLLVDSSIAILSTKIPILPGYGFWGF